MKDQHLDPDKIIETLYTLHNRIHERFPAAGLAGVCEKLLEIARRTRSRSEEIARPIVWVRLLAAGVIVSVLATFVWTATHLELPDERLTANEFVQVLEAGINDVVLIGATVFFFVTLETRIKRARALRAIHELRSVAHIIDMHQLTKDPERILQKGRDTKSSPRRTMTKFELSRYLDYCSEMLALIGKVAALYVQEFSDSTAVSAVNDVESLTTGMARKIWQKLMVLNALSDEPDQRPAAGQRPVAGQPLPDPGSPAGVGEHAL